MPIAYLSAQISDTQFKWSTIVKEGYAMYYVIKKWRHYLDDADILLKSDTKSLEKNLHGRTDNHKLGQVVPRAPRYKHKGRAYTWTQKTRLLTVCPDYLLLQEKEIVHALKDEVSLSIINECDKPTDICCSLCEIDLTNTKELQQSDKHCIRIAKLIAGSQE